MIFRLENDQDLVGRPKKWMSGYRLFNYCDMHSFMRD